jgi:hypothetical protein
VQFKGNLLAGKAYTAQLWLEAGDEFEIKLGRKQIKLTPPTPAPPTPGALRLAPPEARAVASGPAASCLW